MTLHESLLDRAIRERREALDAVVRLRQAAEDAAVWLEAEADHPRPDPRPAMRQQASLLRAAVGNLKEGRTSR